MMDNLNEYYKDLSRIIKWCLSSEEKLKLLQPNSSLEGEDVDSTIALVQNFKRVCNIYCRQIELMKSNKKKINIDIFDSTISLFLSSFDRTKESVDKVLGKII
jgi:hypothetical protein